MEAAEDFEDNSIDFVYIDANHGFKYVAEDLWEWSKKVRSGGVISGHDYAMSKDAHDKYSFFILGRKATVEGEVRDKHPSFMWIKK